MKSLMTMMFLSASFLLPFPAFAEIKTVTHTITQPFGGSQSPDDARIAGIAKAKREALEQFGTYIESTTVVKNAQVDSDEILALTVGVTKAEVIKQKNFTDGDAFGIEITVKVELDTAVLEKSLKRLLEDRNHLKDLKAAREREKKLLVRIADLEKLNNQKGKTKQQTTKLKQDFKAVSQGLTVVDWFDKASTLWNGGKYTNPKKANEYLSQAIRLDPNYATVFNNRGNTFLELKQFKLAIADYDQAIRLDPNIAIAYYNRGAAYNDLKQFESAISDYEKAIRLNPNYTDAYYNRGLAYSKLHQDDRAIEDFNQVIHLNPQDAAAYLSRGLAFDSLKQLDRAMPDYDMAISLNPNDADAYGMRAAGHSERKQFERAMSDYDHAIRLKPSDAMSYLGRGSLYSGNKQFDRALADFDQAIRLIPISGIANSERISVIAYSERGKVYQALNLDQQAIADFDQVIRRNPNSIMAYINRGSSYLNLKKYQHAIADCDQAMGLDPKFSLAYGLQGLAYAKSGNLQIACKKFAQECRLGDCDTYESLCR